MIYLDNAATTIDKDESVAKAVYNAIYSRNFANPSRGAYIQSLNSLKLLMETRKNVGKLFGMDNPLNVVLTSNVTFGLNFVIKSLFSKYDHIITSISEHNSVLRPLYDLEKDGLSISYIGLDNFSLRLSEIENNIRDNSKALILTGASNISGMVTDIDKAYAICKKNNLILIIDGAQLAGYVDFDISKYDNTIFLFTGHKGLHAPQGTGGFVVNGDFDFKQVFSGGSGFNSFSKKQPQSLPDLFEPGTENVHSFAGLNQAVKLALKNPHYIELDDLTRYLSDGLRNIDNLIFYKDFSKKSVPIVSFNIKNLSANYVAMKLWDDYSICTRAGSHCAPLFHKNYKTEKQGIVRLSLSYYNTKDEIKKALNAIEKIKKNS
ncbi:aminotransferase class V-fold PLP-dependent enzyme [Anaerococcus sp. AGMB00486]|uniref:Aminotransferase class V-fold PLP-dependent enzyme n=1 Tax=Anaerococcus faecalis TaxID=2742993 RepID=A0ABX2NCD8_9FIRM|nr:aminotransferase class V-fold PLP-dependent enzyme [Anaerococcus faecalis]NVF12330.1 aminotransferase class V-fold PLP-dependent enzyme [Anaerococcus faecalis]